MDVLLTAFKGNNNSSKILLDLISTKRDVDELYLEPDYRHCEQQLNKQLNRKTYDVIFSFEQQSDIDSIVIETTASQEGNKLVTTFPVKPFMEYLKGLCYKVKLSSDAGAQLSNHIYAIGLNRIERENLPTQMVLIHIPPMNGIDILQMAKDCSHYLSHNMNSNK